MLSAKWPRRERLTIDEILTRPGATAGASPPAVGGDSKPGRLALRRFEKLRRSEGHSVDRPARSLGPARYVSSQPKDARALGDHGLRKVWIAPSEGGDGFTVGKAENLRDLPRIEQVNRIDSHRGRL